ncbi:MAG: mannose-6-phosphate isomerase, class, partial [Arthrobacter sp.]|nr:mannose-6-phosphate isomerase, class [Arthrobacter sp.]
MYELENVLRPYAWGSTTAIAHLLGRPASGGPEAELWIGAHPDSPSVALSYAAAGSGGAHAAGSDDDGRRRLDALIAEDPAHHLGGESIAEFGPRLPFLLKVLAAEHPLSLQVHPTLEQAREGYAREEAAGIDPAATGRNYKDDNHKPEMILALTDFEALCGFRPAAASRAVFLHLAACFDLAGLELPPLLPRLLADLAQPDESAGLRSAFE